MVRGRTMLEPPRVGASTSPTRDAAVLYQIGGFEYLGRHDPYFSGRVTELKALAREIEQRLIDLEAKR
jgi:hypothetical protein